MRKNIKIKFLGAAEGVTGSKTLLTINGKKILIDCGLFQGPRKIREKNWQKFEGAESIDTIVLTHAHVDHSGYLPKVVKEGFHGPIYCSSGTKDLCKIILLDSAYLQEEDARFANERKHSRHSPALPLYTTHDAKEALKLFHPLPMREWKEIFPQISVRLIRSGHILGSSFVQVAVSEDQKTKIITFSGDLGNHRQNVIKGPSQILSTDYLVLESTYGDRTQSKESPEKEIERCIKKIMKNKGVLVIPSFAVGRTQEILYILRKLEQEEKIPSVPVFLDSPMAVNATEIYFKHQDELKLRSGGDGLVEPLSPGSYKVTRTPDESMLLCMKDGPMVVVSASGMLTGGRVLHHLKARLPKPENIVLFVGYQAEETKGRLLKQGLPKIRIHHQLIDVEAEIIAIDCFSAHADSQDLVDWVEQIDHPPKLTFLNHGEEGPLNALKYRLQSELKLSVTIPKEGEEFILN